MLAALKNVTDQLAYQVTARDTLRESHTRVAELSSAVNQTRVELHQAINAKAAAEHALEAKALVIDLKQPARELSPMDDAQFIHGRSLRTKNLDALQKEVDGSAATVTRLTAQLATLERELENAQTQLKNRKASVHDIVNVTTKDLGQHKAKVKQADAEIARLQALIRQQESIATERDDGALAAARKERQSLLADIAEGKAEQGLLTSMDKKLSTLEKDITTQNNQARLASETLQGLRPRLDSAEQYAVDLRDQAKHLLANYVRGQMAEVAKQYAKLAKPLAEAYVTYQAMFYFLEQNLPGLATGVYLASEPDIEALGNKGMNLYRDGDPALIEIYENTQAELSKLTFES